MAAKKKTENFMREVTTEKEWESLCKYQVKLNYVLQTFQLCCSNSETPSFHYQNATNFVFPVV